MAVEGKAAWQRQSLMDDDREFDDLELEACSCAVVAVCYRHLQHPDVLHESTRSSASLISDSHSTTAPAMDMCLIFA